MGADLKTCKTILFIAALLASCLSHATTTITFDEFALSGPPIQDGYANLRWDNFSPQKGSKQPLTGYANGVVSGQNVAFNGFGSPATISSDKAFDLFSGFFAAAWHNELAVKVVASGLNSDAGVSIFLARIEFSQVYHPACRKKQRGLRPFLMQQNENRLT